MPTRPSAVRRALTWWFSPPANPYVCVSGAIDAAPAQAWLAGLRAQDRPITLQHLITGAVAQALRAHPAANARVQGGRIVTAPHVGVGMPVNLLGHAGGAKRELSATLLERAETLSLQQVSELTRGKVAVERTGQVQNPVMRGLLRWADHAPSGLLERGLDGLDGVLQTRWGAAGFYAAVPITTGITNPGATIRGDDGMLFRAVSIQIPNRVLSVGTIWGVSAVQDEVIAVDGQPAVRPMLPVLLAFDHRILDGVAAGRLMKTFATVLRDPGAIFGPLGDQPPTLPA